MEPYLFFHVCCVNFIADTLADMLRKNDRGRTAQTAEWLERLPP